MKNLFIFLLFLLLQFSGFADDRPTINSLLNKTISISDNFAGQSIRLIKKSNQYSIIRYFHGSGIPVTKTLTYAVEFINNYQIRFSKIVEGIKSKTESQFNEEFTLSIFGKKDIRLYLNNIQIVTKIHSWTD